YLSIYSNVPAGRVVRSEVAGPPYMNYVRACEGVSPRMLRASPSRSPPVSAETALAGPVRGKQDVCMKLAEALTLRSQLQTRFQLLRERVKASAMVQEGESPPEDPTTLLAELEAVAAEVETLIARINKTNLATSCLTAGRLLTLSRDETISVC